MSRAASSVADATRFTATSPHASSKPIAPRLSTAKILKSRPSPNAASSHISSQPGVHPLPGLDRAPGPPGETPAQKVARLRAAHLAKRAAEISTWDKVVVRGRQIADTAHKWTVTGIMGITGEFALSGRGVERARSRLQHFVLMRRLIQDCSCRCWRNSLHTR